MRYCKHFGCLLRRVMLLILCVSTLMILSACISESVQMSYDTPRQWKPVYNGHKHGAFISTAVPVAFQERMAEEDIAKILPEKPLPFAVDQAIVKFKEDRSVYSVVLYIGSAENYTAVALGDGAVMNYCCSFRNKGENKSPCGNVEYTLYELDDDLMAEAVINNIPLCARTFGTIEKQEFEAILECFSWYSAGNLYLQEITPREH